MSEDILGIKYFYRMHSGIILISPKLVPLNCRFFTMEALQLPGRQSEFFSERELQTCSYIRIVHVITPREQGKIHNKQMLRVMTIEFYRRRQRKMNSHTAPFVRRTPPSGAMDVTLTFTAIAAGSMCEIFIITELTNEGY